MARKSKIAATAASSRSSSKRAAPATPSRQSKRAKAATRKSYVEPGSDEDIGSPTAEQEDAKDSEYGAGSGMDDATETDSDHEEANSEDEDRPTTKARGRNAKRTVLPLHKKQHDESELWKHGAKIAPGTQVIIKRPKAREAGSVPYTDETIHPNTMLFLKDLAVNNERQWLKAHDPDYRNALKDFTTFVECLSQKVIEADDTIPELPVKDIIFRIYRDIRFSKDPTPYKTHFSAAWSRTGRKGPYAAYYVQVEPDGGSFVGGGLWQPESRALEALRRDIAREPHKIKRVLNDAGIRRAFFGGVADDESEAVNAFVNQPTNRSTALKRHPKGYAGDHEEIELLRLRNFTLGTKVTDNEVLGPEWLNRAAGLIASMVPFARYLNSVVMPDGEDSAEEDEDGSSGDDSAGGGEVDA